MDTKDEVFKSWFRINEERANNYVNRNSVELYNIIEDPYQLHNLAVDPQFEPVLKKMDNKLNEFMLQQGDKGIATEAMAEKMQNSHN